MQSQDRLRITAIESSSQRTWKWIFKRRCHSQEAEDTVTSEESQAVSYKIEHILAN